jgi:hypothetical protein
MCDMSASTDPELHGSLVFRPTSYVNFQRPYYVYSMILELTIPRQVRDSRGQWRPRSSLHLAVAIA